MVTCQNCNFPPPCPRLPAEKLPAEKPNSIQIQISWRQSVYKPYKAARQISEGSFSQGRHCRCYLTGHDWTTHHQNANIIYTDARPWSRTRVYPHTQARTHPRSYEETSQPKLQHVNVYAALGGNLIAIRWARVFRFVALMYLVPIQWRNGKRRQTIYFESLSCVT